MMTMTTQEFIEIIQQDYDILRKAGIGYLCCCLTLETLVKHLGGNIICGKIIIPIPPAEFSINTIEEEK